MKLNKIKNIVSSLAPTLGAAIGGPLGGQAGQILSQVLGVKNSPPDIENAINNLTAEQMVELKKAEKDFQLQMKQFEIDIYSLETQDTQNAREKFSGDWTPKFLGSLTVVGFIGYIFISLLLSSKNFSKDPFFIPLSSSIFCMDDFTCSFGTNILFFFISCN